MVREPGFEVRLTTDERPNDTLLVGVADPGLAGLTAGDYLVSHGEFEQIGYVRTENLPDITPFSNGTPRHPIRLYNSVDGDLTVLVSEIFVPVAVADLMAAALTDWAVEADIEHIAALFGAPIPHHEQEHTVFHVATEGFKETVLADADVPGLAGGFFDGILGEILVRAMAAEGPDAGVLLTPSHPPGPDFDGALRLLETVEDLFGLGVDKTELERRSASMKEYYQQLSDRLETLRESDGTVRDRDFAEDRMYM